MDWYAMWHHHYLSTTSFFTIFLHFLVFLRCNQCIINIDFQYEYFWIRQFISAINSKPRENVLCLQWIFVWSKFNVCACACACLFVFFPLFFSAYACEIKNSFCGKWHSYKSFYSVVNHFNSKSHQVLYNLNIYMYGEKEWWRKLRKNVVWQKFVTISTDLCIYVFVLKQCLLKFSKLFKNE